MTTVNVLIAGSKRASLNRILLSYQESSTGQSVEFSPMELSALVGTPAAPNMPAEEGEGMAGVTGEEPFDTLDTFLRELQADLAEASQPTSTTSSVTASCRRQRYNIAAANPLLAGTNLDQVSVTPYTRHFTYDSLCWHRKISSTFVADVASLHPLRDEGGNQDGEHSAGNQQR